MNKTLNKIYLKNHMVELAAESSVARPKTLKSPSLKGGGRGGCKNNQF